MSAENRLHFFRMCAWGMFDPDALPPRERKVRLRQIRQVIEDVGYTLHVGIWRDRGTNRPWYSLNRSSDAAYHVGHGPNMEIICKYLLPIVDKKFPPSNPTR